jgi:uncharacterized protein YbaP (TraB family)
VTSRYCNIRIIELRLRIARENATIQKCLLEITERLFKSVNEANDLIFRTVMRDQGATVRVAFAEVATTAYALNESALPELQAIGQRLGSGLKAWTEATDWVIANAKSGISCASSSRP